ncbi:plastocyanin/azurin family copper-binding protein [Variovorax sp. dw_954]|uniref:YVTN family beta-propeller repeat protein n=1 Tax=Variovorax sp. dw_954 TaxID=2720078 RepID=UPI001BD3E21F|nr:plastocyanin/azurin family copper-binding protein [Variovorax sp. dw_954]
MRFIQLPSVLLRGAVAAGIAMLTATALAAGPRVYVGNFKDNTVSVVDIDAAKVVATVPVAAGPDGIVVSADGKSVFVSGSGASSLSVIDAGKDSVGKTIEVGSGPQGLALGPDGKQVLVAVNGADRVAFVDVASGAVADTVPVPKPHTIAIKPDGSQAYVSSQQPGSFAVAIVDMATHKVSGAIALDKPPRDLEFSPDGKLLYLTLAGAPAVQVVDAVANKIVAQIATGVSPHIAQHFASLAQGVVVVQGPGELQFFDPATNAVARSIAVGKQPHWVDITPDGKRLVVSNEGGNSISIVDPASGQSQTVDVGNAPRKVAMQHASAAGHADMGGGAKVSIANFAFVPGPTTITAGQSVTWRNDDGAPHGVAFQDKAPGAPLLLPGEQFSRRFDKPGSYEYVCSVHAYMTGVVVVKPEPARQL